ncbi:EAL domain-containing protein [Pseudomaricurvus sp. HS19]|uniref:bifunctional diguanylate cyclase/phosphodiesterase n=1 Tax=Pseudomaricurvus sp. HS19 TaxID=2692626 RepID=UPI001370AA0B|nr:EAL domain-containing protein [Pseudomaricurvus sp. HS19]MYM63278.1 EAL domain-containing protein [Pseudomaricurvus sp. HS19]
MTLYRQLSVAITLLIVVLMAGNVTVTVFNARSFLAEQMQVHAQDTATSLGLTISHAAQGLDRAQVQSVIDAVFDHGFYQRVAYRSYNGQLMLERKASAEVNGVPGWFVELLAVPVAQGKAEVVTGWMRLGELTVVSHSGLVYRDLWRVFVGQVWLFLLTALASYGLLALGLRVLLRPLQRLEVQADAITRREFPLQERLPRTRELRSVVQAMNHMVRRLQVMFQEQLELTESLHQQACVDSVTGLSTRRDFDNRFTAFVNSDSSGSSGLLLLLHVEGLIGLNTREGRQAGDLCLFQLANMLGVQFGRQQGAILARRSGTDLCVFVPWLSQPEAEQATAELWRQIQGLSWFQNGNDLQVTIGAVFERSVTVSSGLLDQADSALGQAQGDGGVHWYEHEHHGGRSAAEWHEFLQLALEQRLFQFHVQPVYQRDGETVEQLEVLCRVRDGDALLSAGQFLPRAERFGLAAAIDQQMIELLTDYYTQADGPRVCVNLASGAVADESFCQWLQQWLLQHPLFARRLVIELPEHALNRGDEPLREFGRRLSEAGASLSLDHFGVGARAFACLQSLPLQALKVHRSFVQGIDHNPDHQFFVKSLRQIAHSCGIRLLAEGIESEAEWQTLLDLGIDGGQGYYLTEPQAPGRYAGNPVAG